LNPRDILKTVGPPRGHCHKVAFSGWPGRWAGGPGGAPFANHNSFLLNLAGQADVFYGAAGQIALILLTAQAERPPSVAAGAIPPLYFFGTPWLAAFRLFSTARFQASNPFGGIQGGWQYRIKGAPHSAPPPQHPPPLTPTPAPVLPARPPKSFFSRARRVGGNWGGAPPRYKCPGCCIFWLGRELGQPQGPEKVLFPGPRVRFLTIFRF